MNEIHENYELLRSVKLDVKTLLMNFKNTSSIRFSDFCEEWKKLNFSSIFGGKITRSELMEFIELLYDIVKTYLDPPWTAEVRIGALYILYSLYFKQPMRELVKIRVTLKEWKHLSDLIKQCKEAHQYDVCFIFYKLYADSAFIFTIVSKQHGLEESFRKYSLTRKVKKNYISDKILGWSNLNEESLLDSIISLETLYVQKKNEILGDNNLKFVSENFALSLIKKLNHFQRKHHGQSNIDFEDEDKADEICSPELDEFEDPVINREPEIIFNKPFKLTEKEVLKTKRRRRKE